MRVSLSWLKAFVEVSASPEVLAERLTMAGLEVEAVEPVAPPFSGVVVALVEAVEPHPNADRLRVCTVSTGQERLQVVCGAPNVRPGLKAPLALVGATLPGMGKLKEARIRGVLSRGMLCSARELGLAEEAEGIMELPEEAPVGEELRRYLDLDDRVLEIALTPNRADCLSHEGVAREVAVLFQKPLRKVEPKKAKAHHRETLPLEIAAPEGCPRYLGRVIRGVDTRAKTPLWMVERLRRCGLRSLGPVVDVTNYVLLELGQPLHAFDAAMISGGVVVRWGREGEQLTLLNGQTVALQEDILVIADHEKPLALAGIMGGLESAVSETTETIFLECAFFRPEAIRGRARRFGLQTDASYRFERGVDPELQERAMARATELILEIAGGEAGPITEALFPEWLPKREAVRLRRERLSWLLGIEIPEGEVEAILRRLEMEVETLPEGWRVVPPSFRFDIALEEDLIEEVARIYGYQNLPSRSLSQPVQVLPEPEGRLSEARIRELLADRDYFETITFSFVNPSLQERLTPHLSPVRLQNPLSREMAVMRTTLWSGLLPAVRHNLNRQRSRVRLFEIGSVFRWEGERVVEEVRLGGVATGPWAPEQWGLPKREVDLFDLKGDLEALFQLTGQKAFRFEAAEHPALHPGQSARILKGEEAVGWLGRLHPKLERELDLKAPLYLFEVALEAVAARAIPTFRPLPRFPAVRRDLALVVDRAVPAGELLEAIREIGGRLLKKVVLFDLYEGEGLPEGKRSLGFGLLFQDPERTLTDEEVDQLIEEIVGHLRERFAAELRA